MNKKLILILILAIIFLAQTESKKIKQPKVQQETTPEQQQAQEELAKQAEAERQQAEAERQKAAEEAAAAKAEQKRVKAEEKAKRNAEKAQQKEQEDQRKAEEKRVRDEQKQQEKEAQRLQKEQQKQEQLAALAATQCQAGTFRENQECQNCSENCENCSSATQCNYCKPGFYRVLESKQNTYCASSIPTGYLPQLKNFWKLNPQLTQSQKNYEGTAVAMNGKKPITKEPTPLPYEIVGGAPQVSGEKVRLDVAPCQTHCSTCPEGYLRNPATRGCTTEQSCVFPNEIVNDAGVRVCKPNDPAVFRGQVIVGQRPAQNPNAQFPEKQRISLQAQINKPDNINISYTWSAKDQSGADITATVFPSGSLGAKIKANISGFTTGQNYTFSCVVQEGESQNTVSAQFTA